MPDRVVQVVHPAPVLRRAPRERNGRLLWAAIRTPVTLREVSPADLGPAMRARGVATAVDMHAMDGGLWWALRRKGLHSREAEASPFLDVDTLVGLLQRDEAFAPELLDYRHAACGTPLLAFPAAMAVGGSEGVALDHLVHDGREEAAARLRDWMDRNVVACDGRALVRTHGILVHRRRLDGMRRAVDEWTVQFGLAGQAYAGRYDSVERHAQALAYERAHVGPGTEPCAYLESFRVDPGMGGDAGASVVAANRIAVMADRLADRHMLGRFNVAPRRALVAELELEGPLATLSGWAREGWFGGIAAADAPRAVAAAKSVLAALGTVRLWERDELLARHMLDVEHFEGVLAPDLAAAAAPLEVAPEDEAALGGLAP